MSSQPVPYMNPQGPAGAWPAAAVAARNRMVDFENALLTAAQKLYPGATLQDGFTGAMPTGMTTLTINGKVLPVYQITEPWLTPEQWLAQNAAPKAPDPPPIVRDPGPATDVPFQDTDGRWYYLSSPFLFKIACQSPPPTAPTAKPAANTKAQTIGAIRKRLEAQPPKPQPVIDELMSLAIEVNAFPE